MSERFRFSLTLLLLLGSIVVAAFLVWPARGAIRDAQRRLLIARAKVERVKAIASAFNALEETIAKTSEKTLVASAIPSLEGKPNDAPEILVAVERLASREALGVVVKSVKVGEPERISPNTFDTTLHPGEVVSRTISIEGLGNYESLNRFLDALEQSLPLLEPVSLSFTVNPQESVLEFRATIRSFAHVPCKDTSFCEPIVVPPLSPEGTPLPPQGE